MWQLICLCLPGMTREERQRFLTLFSQVVQSYNRELGEVDLGLSFLYTLTPAEALIVLEERLDLVEHSREILTTPPPETDKPQHMMHTLVQDHIDTLLEAERTWLVRAIQRLRGTISSDRKAVHCPE